MRPETISFRRRKLPHWRVVGHSYFVTFRLYGTIPLSVIEELKHKKKQLDTSNEDDISKFQRYEFRKIETILDRCPKSESLLSIPEIAKTILESFDFIETKYKWRIPCLVIMPNHIHCLCSGENALRSLDKMIMKLKGWTAYQANKILGRTGHPFWSQEFFDHWCRTPEKEESVKRYIINNPVKAGLAGRSEDWPWLKK